MTSGPETQLGEEKDATKCETKANRTAQCALQQPLERAKGGNRLRFIESIVLFQGEMSTQLFLVPGSFWSGSKGTGEPHFI